MWLIRLAFVKIFLITLLNRNVSGCQSDTCDLCNSEEVCHNGFCDATATNELQNNTQPSEYELPHVREYDTMPPSESTSNSPDPIEMGNDYAKLTNAFQRLVSQKDFAIIFPHRWYVSPEWKNEYSPIYPWFYPEMKVDYYSYQNFVDAVDIMTKAGHVTFLNEPGTTDEERKRELCAFFANIGHETGRGNDGLFYREELGYEQTQGGWEGGYREVLSRTNFRMSNKPVYFRQGSKLTGKIRFRSTSYHGRGPIQLSNAYNYGDFSKAIYGDPQVLLENPDRLLDEPKLGISSAIWFWMTQPDWRLTHNPHKSMYKSTSALQPWGFARTIMAINGGVEQNAKENGPKDADKQVTRRIQNYRQCALHFKIPIGVNGEKLDTTGLSN